MSDRGMLCPICRVGLVMSERQGVEIDYCPNCRGVWLDRGELDKIIERSETQLPMQQQQTGSPFTAPGQYHQDYEQRDERRYEQQGQRKRSFWSEIFD